MRDVNCPTPPTARGERPPPLEDDKTLNVRVEAALARPPPKAAKPAPKHPWRQAAAMAVTRAGASPTDL